MPEEEKTEQATPRRRQEAREQGQVAASRDLSSAIILLAGFLFLSFYGSAMLRQIINVEKGIFTSLGSITISRDNYYVYSIKTILVFVSILAPFMIVVTLVAVLANIGQFGFIFSFKTLIPNISKLNPISGIKRIFSLKTVVQLLINIMKLIVIAWIAYLTIIAAMPQILLLSDMDLMQIFCFGCSLVFRLGIRICLALLILSFFDYAYQKWEYEKSLRMTRQEVKEELKRMEGDPKIKARIRSIQLQLSRQRMMREIPEADVVITNPIHIAVVVKYKPGQMSAPKVVAKGARILAEKIKQIAFQNSIPIVENKFLAQALYRSVGIGEMIPAKLYQAVAEILAYVYQLDKKKLETVTNALD